jgi:hypothetical protein
MKTIYISGPMSGYENYNFPAFNAAANEFRSRGYGVINPADFGDDPSKTWRQCLERDLVVMFNADLVLTLTGWENSKGAKLEVFVAESLGIPVHHYKDFVATDDDFPF